MSESEGRKIRLSIYISCYSKTRWFGELLESLLNSDSATEADITAAMTALTRAMAGIY